MSAITSPGLLEQTRAEAHPRCVVCGSPLGNGLGLRFAPSGDGEIEAVFACDECYEGYEGLLHGGVTSSLLDGAMTNCLFAHGIVALTGELTVRFRHPVVLATPAVIRARRARSLAPLHVLEAEVVQDGEVKATAVGKFMERRAD